MKLSRLHWGRNAGWGYLATVCWGMYVDIRGRRLEDAGEKCIMQICMTCTPVGILTLCLNRGGGGMSHAWARTEVGTGFWLERLKLRDCMEDVSIILKFIVENWDGKACIGVTWLRRYKGVALLASWWWTFGFCKMRRIFWLAEGVSSLKKKTPFHGDSPLY
jgi:hypothetical protein